MGELIRSIYNLLEGRIKTEGELLDIAEVNQLLDRDRPMSDFKAAYKDYRNIKPAKEIEGEDGALEALERINLGFRPHSDQTYTYAEHHAYENISVAKHYLYIREGYLMTPPFSDRPHKKMDIEYTVEKDP